MLVELLSESCPRDEFLCLVYEHDRPVALEVLENFRQFLVLDAGELSGAVPFDFEQPGGLGRCNRLACKRLDRVDAGAQELLDRAGMMAQIAMEDGLEPL